jgi:hypothetical protein
MRSGTIFRSDFDPCAGSHLRRAWNLSRRRMRRPQVAHQSIDKTKQGFTEMDIVMLGMGILSFAALFAYIKLCDSL